MVSFSSIVVPLSVALGLSLMVERVIEFTKHLFERLLPDGNETKLPEVAEIDRRAKATLAAEAARGERVKAEEAYRTVREASPDAAEDDGKPRANTVAPLAGQGEWQEQVSELAMFAVEPAQPPNMTRVLREFVTHLLGLATGIVLAHVFELKLFHAFVADVRPLSNAADYVLTGLLIGGGSAPVHLLMQFISERKVTPQAAPIDAKEELPPAQEPRSLASTAVDPLHLADWVDIPYEGGVDRAALQGSHRRSGDPEMIVIHHTAMPMDSTFEDVVRTIKGHTDSRGNHWKTGYHCVVMGDGAIRPFCPWDLFGNHAMGYNDRSLGLAFNGNFEPDPKVPYSNVGGKYGPARPTDAQLKAGARVVALWILLYDIRLDFDKCIIPHAKVSDKSCPGSGFPLETFHTLVRDFVAKWRSSDAVQARLAGYRRKPYLYVDTKATEGGEGRERDRHAA